jgi:hypothetical protein
VLASDALSKLTHSLSEVWPKALVSLAIPAAQFIWHQWQEKQPDRRRESLRKTIHELDDYLKTAPPGSVECQDATQERDEARRALFSLVIQSTEHGSQKRQQIRESISAVSEFLQQQNTDIDPALRQEADRALSRLRTQLAHSADPGHVAAPAAPVPRADAELPLPAPAPDWLPRSPSRPFWRTAFLLYSPGGGWGWISHSLFFMGLVITAGMVIDGISNSFDEDTSDALLGWGLITLVFRGFAVLSDRGFKTAAPVRRGPRSWLLLFPPRGVAACLVHLLFYVVLLVTVVGVPGSLADGETDTWYALVVLLPLLYVLRVIALRIEARRTKPSLATAAGQS